MVSTTGRAGFSLVEVVLALVVLSVGVLAMGMSTGHLLTQIRAADFRTERMTAVRDAGETLRSAPWTELETTCSTHFQVGEYEVTCTVTRPSSNLARVELVSSGPGFRDGSLRSGISETQAISLAKPLP